MSAAACKIIIDEGAALLGPIACLSGSAPIADIASGGEAVTMKKAERFARAARRFREETEALVNDLSGFIPPDTSAADGRTRPPSGINRGDAPPER